MKLSKQMVGGQEHLFCEKKDQRELWLFSLKRRSVQEDLTARFWYQKKPKKKAREELLTGACSDGTKTNGFKLK